MLVVLAVVAVAAMVVALVAYSRGTERLAELIERLHRRATTTRRN